MAKKALVIKAARKPKFAVHAGELPGVTKSSW